MVGGWWEGGWEGSRRIVGGRWERNGKMNGRVELRVVGGL